MHFLGLMGMPRRIPDYPDFFFFLNFICTVGSTLSVLSLVIFAYNICCVKNFFFDGFSFKFFLFFQDIYIVLYVFSSFVVLMEVNSSINNFEPSRDSNESGESGDSACTLTRPCCRCTRCYIIGVTLICTAAAVVYFLFTGEMPFNPGGGGGGDRTPQLEAPVAEPLPREEVFVPSEEFHQNVSRFTDEELRLEQESGERIRRMLARFEKRDN